MVIIAIEGYSDRGNGGRRKLLTSGTRFGTQYLKDDKSVYGSTLGHPE